MNIFKELTIISLAGIITWLAWSVVPLLDSSKIQAIASTIATVDGILFGFVLASVTMLASVKDNVLIQNIQKTKYLSKLMLKLHITMGLLLLSCIIFLICLFIPDKSTLSIEHLNINEKIISLVIEFGVFSFSIAVFKFYEVWKTFIKIIENM